ncbi:MAG: endonuclease III [Bacteroidota bacterium]
MTKKQLFNHLIEYFEINMPNAASELNYSNPYELLVAVILSAQCTDVRVNKITPNLFLKYPTVNELANSTIDDIFALIRSCSYPNNKSKHLLGMAKMVCSDFNGTIPSDVEELQAIPGVGRKTANVIASVIFNKPTMAVDTHVHRVSARIGLTSDAKTPLETERQLVRYIPDSKIPIAHHWLILHGRYTCKARKPICKDCGLTDVCKWYKLNMI